MSSKYYHTQRQSSSIKGLLTPLGGWDSHFSRHQPIIPSSEPSPFKGIFPKNRWSWKLFTLHSSLIPALEGRNLFLILQESQTPLFQRGRILSSLLDIPRPVPLYYISCLLGSVCGVDFLPGNLYFPSTTHEVYRKALRHGKSMKSVIRLIRKIKGPPEIQRVRQSMHFSN